MGSFNFYNGELINVKRFLVILLMIFVLVLTGCYYKWFYSLSISVSGEGAVNVQGEKNSEKGKYEKYTDLILTAEASPGWKFVDWTGDISSDDNPLNFKIQDDINLTANFERDSFSVATTIVGNGRIEISPEKDEYEYGEEITLKAFPDENWEFHGWSGDITSSEKNVTFNIDKNMNITATFEEKQFGVSVEIEGEGDVEVTPDKELYDYGDLVSFAAAAADGWTFEGWSGYIESDDNPLLVQIEEDIALNALFIKNEFPVNIEIFGNGSVEKQPDKNSYYENEEVQITAIPDVGWTFESWGGDINSTQTEIDVTVDSTKNYSANFIQNKYYITQEITGEGTINMNPEKKYYSYGDVVEVTAISEDGWIFSEWYGSLSEEENPKQIVVDSDMNIGAVFLETFECELIINGEGNVSLNPVKDNYLEGDEISLIATPFEGNEFVKWVINGVEYHEDELDFTVEEDLQIECFFKSDDAMILSIEIHGEGSVEVEDPQEYYYFNDREKLFATPEDGWVFNTWSGDSTGRFTERSLFFSYWDLSISAEFSTYDEYQSNLELFDAQWNTSKSIGVEAAYESFYEDTKAGVYFVDYRSEEDVIAAHITNAVWIAFTGDDSYDLEQVQELFPDPEKCRFVVYGNRGEGFTENNKLNSWGYKSVVMPGGICDWVDPDIGGKYPIVNGLIHNK
jgi:hypothetical protein